MQHGAKRSAALQTRDPGCLNQSKMGEFVVHIRASRYRGTMYANVTNNPARRIGEHRGGIVPGFTRRYKVNKLVYIERYASILEARARERAVKRWRRDWKFKLIEAENPNWNDLTDLLS